MKKINLFVIVSTLILIGGFMGYKIVQAVGGQGTATIDGSVPGGNVTVAQATSHKFTVVLSIGASGITADAQNPTFTIPAGFTAPDANPVANAGLVVADGDWSVSAAGGICTVDNPAVGLTAALGQVITVDVTTTCTVAIPDTITLTYQGQSAGVMAATPLTIKTADDIGWGVVTAIPASPTITVTAVDIIPPTVAVTMDDTALNIGDTSLVTFTFSEVPVGFTTADVVVANGSIGAIDVSNPLIQTAIYTPTNGITDATNIITVGTAWTDAALNSGVGDDSPNYMIDTIAPTVTVAMSDVALTVGDTSLVTFTFSEVPVGFTVADITSFPNGTLSLFTVTGNPLIYTVIFTPLVSINDATNIITVGTAWTDAALNSGVGDDSPNYTINTVVPVSSAEPQPATINVVKVVINDSGGTNVAADFSLFVNGKPITSGVTNTFPTTGSVYTVTETPNSNYIGIFSGDCDANGQLNLNGGQNKFCIVTNNDIGGPLYVAPPLPDLIKVVNTVSSDAPMGLTPKDIAIATVVVVVPKLPDTGLPPKENTLWNIAIPAGILITLFSFYLSRKKQIN